MIQLVNYLFRTLFVLSASLFGLRILATEFESAMLVIMLAVVCFPVVYNRKVVSKKYMFVKEKIFSRS